MKRFVRTICLVVSVAMLLAFPVFAETSEPRSSAFFISYDSFIDVITAMKMEIWFDVVGAGDQDELGVSSIKIQRSSDGQNWTDRKTFYPENYPQMIVENTFVVYDCVTYYGTPGYYYRAYVVFYAKKGNGTGEMSQYSEVVYLPPQN